VRWKSRRNQYGASLPAAEESLEELRELAAAAGAVVVDALLQQRDAPDSATLVGRGKVEEVKGLVAGLGADLVVFDHELSPTQLRNLERELECRVIDRTQLILDIFARHARTSEGQLQVELAQLNYMLPRLSGQSPELSRLGGGIGTRGPGEQKLELDRRRIRRRIANLQESLDRVRRQRAQQRGRRTAVPLPAVALVGYTNAGKSTLFNRLTGAGVLTSKRMFATLDPTLRGLTLPSHRQVLLSDTVGFIRHLPTTLVKAFRATLEEVCEAVLLLQVTDAAAPAQASHDAQVDEVLEELGAAGKPRIHVLNKVDLLSPEERAALPGGPGSAAVSAISGEGIQELLRAIDAQLPADPLQEARFRLPHNAGAALSLLYDHARVLERSYHDGIVEIRAELPESLLRRLQAYEVHK
jgi:GTP-binding protein HflX